MPPPEKTYPSDGQTDVVPPSVILRWAGEEEAEGYEWEISKINDPWRNKGSIASVSTETSVALPSTGSYRWNVRSCWYVSFDDLTCGSWGLVFTFTTAGAAPCEPKWQCDEWSAMPPTTPCGQSFTQSRACEDGCGSFRREEQQVIGSYCPIAGQTCQSTDVGTLVCASGDILPPTTFPTTPPIIPTSLGSVIKFENPLKAESIPELLDALINFIFWIGITIAPIIFIIAGFLFVTAVGDTKRLETAKQMMLYAIIGLAVLLLAKGLVAVLKSIIGVQ